MKIMRNFRIRKSVFILWLISYVSVLIIPVIISGYIYNVAEKVVVEEINRTNSALLNQLRQLMDTQLMDIERLGHQIALNSRTQGLIYVKDSLEPYHYYTVAKLGQDFRLYKIANSFIGGFYLYFKNIGYTLSPNTFCSTGLLFESTHMGGNISYEQWLDIMETRHVRNYISMPRRTEIGELNNAIAFLQSLPIENPSKSEATLVILLDEEKVQETIRSLKWTEQGTVVILDSNDNILAYTQPFAGESPLQYDRLTGDSGLIYSMFNGEKAAISYTASKVYDMKYLTILPVAIYGEKAEYIRRLTLLGIVLCLLAGGLVSCLFLMKNYNPVRELVQSLKSKALIPAGRLDNEYEYIGEAISLTIKEKEKIAEKLNQQSSVVRANFLMRLIKGRLGTNFPLFDVLSSFGIRFKSERFAVILFYLEDYSSFISPKDIEDSEDKLKLIQFVIRNIVEELAGQNHQGFMTEVDGMLACLMSFNGMEKPEDEKRDMLRIADESRRIIGEKFRIYFTVAISDVNETVAGIFKAYQQALEALEYRMLVGRRKIINYSEIKASQTAVVNYKYSLDVELQLVNCVKTGDNEKAEQILNEVIEFVLTKEFHSIQTAKCLMFDVASTILKVIDEMSRVYKDSFPKDLKPAEALLRCETIEEMRLRIADILRTICTYIDDRKRSHNYKLRDDVIEYIKAHYQDENLSISGIAEHFQVSLTYLSKFFKEQTGDGLLDYINRTRLEKAKLLLRESEDNIGDVAKKVGFYNSNALIRIFKKYEGVTPGKFKELTG